MLAFPNCACQPSIATLYIQLQNRKTLDMFSSRDVIHFCDTQRFVHGSLTQKIGYFITNTSIPVFLSGDQIHILGCQLIGSLIHREPYCVPWNCWHEFHLYIYLGSCRVCIQLQTITEIDYVGTFGTYPPLLKTLLIGKLQFERIAEVSSSWSESQTALMVSLLICYVLRI